MPARFQAVPRDRRGRPAAADRSARIDARERELERLRAANPRPQLWRTFDTPGFGAGRNVRFGDLDGDGQIDMLIAQNMSRRSAATPSITSAASPR